MKPVAIVFDLFGTLLNIASLTTAAQQYTSDGAAFVTSWRDKQVAYAFAATIMNRYEDFDTITVRALHYAAARFGLGPTDGDWQLLAQEWRRLAPFADTHAALAQVRAAGIATAVLTNGTAQTARAALHSGGLADLIDVTLSVDAIGCYKPDARVYALATGHFATTPAQLLFVTSNGWDATGAGEFGIPVVWCNRAGAPAETFGQPPAATISGLHSLFDTITARDTIGAELAGH